MHQEAFIYLVDQKLYYLCYINNISAMYQYQYQYQDRYDISTYLLMKYTYRYH